MVEGGARDRHKGSRAHGLGQGGGAEGHLEGGMPAECDRARELTREG